MTSLSVNRSLEEPKPRKAASRQTLLCLLKSRAGSPVGKPVAIVSDRKFLLAALANGLGRRSNMVAVDFVDRLARRAEIEKVIHRHDLHGRAPVNQRMN